MIKQHIFTLLTASFILHQGIAQSTEMFTDPRDGQMYKTISFTSDSTGTTFTWMAFRKITGKTPVEYRSLN